MRKKDPQIEMIEQKRERLRQKLIERLGGDFPITNQQLHNTPEGERVKAWFHRMTVQAHRQMCANLKANERPKK